MDNDELPLHLMNTASPRLLIDTARQAIARAQKSGNADDALANLVWAVEFMAEVVSRLVSSSEKALWLDAIEEAARKGADNLPKE